MRKIEYDFLRWTSFPSSLKIVNDEPEKRWLWYRTPVHEIDVKGGELVSITFDMRGENVSSGTPSHVVVNWFDGTRWSRLLSSGHGRSGTFDWETFPNSRGLPSNVQKIRWGIAGGVGITWFDNFKLYLNGELIYKNTFDNWLPYIIGGGIVTVAGVAGVTKLVKIW